MCKSRSSRWSFFRDIIVVSRVARACYSPPPTLLLSPSASPTKFHAVVCPGSGKYNIVEGVNEQFYRHQGEGGEAFLPGRIISSYTFVHRNSVLLLLLPLFESLLIKNFRRKRNKNCININDKNLYY